MAPVINVAGVLVFNLALLYDIINDAISQLFCFYYKMNKKLEKYTVLKPPQLLFNKYYLIYGYLWAVIARLKFKFTLLEGSRDGFLHC